MSALYGKPDILPMSGSSDHHAVLCQPSPNKHMLGTQSLQTTKRVCGKNERVLFGSSLMAVDWTPLYHLPSCEDQFNLYYKTISDLLDTFLPFKTSSRRKSEKPWVTDQYRDLIKQRQCALFSGDIVSYRSLRNRVNRLTMKLRSSYYHSCMDNLTTAGSKKWWSNMNDLMGRGQSSNAMSNLANQLTEGNMVDLCNKINVTFQKVSSNLPKLVPTHQCPPSPLPAKYSVTVEEVEKKLMGIKVNKAIGPDGIPNWIYRDFAGFLAKPIASIFNASFYEGYIPSIWKSANVVPVPKINPPKLPEKDLRPISLTPVISKTQERFMFSWVWEVIRNKIDNGQFGALKGTSATHALITLMHDLYRGTDDWRKKQYVQVILLDYAKAFDHVDANILMQKLADLDIPDCLLRWIECFLMNRRQRVKIGTNYSEWVEIWGNVPQGTLLGVMCFLCLINDLSPASNTIKYVDDTTIYHVSNDPNDTTLQESINEAIEWSSRNSMKIHPTKTKELFICFAKNPPNVPRITINGSPVERVNECKLLGVFLNDKLTWNEHIEMLHKKASSKLYFLSQLRKSRVGS